MFNSKTKFSQSKAGRGPTLGYSKILGYLEEVRYPEINELALKTNQIDYLLDTMLFLLSLANINEPESKTKTPSKRTKQNDILMRVNKLFKLEKLMRKIKNDKFSMLEMLYPQSRNIKANYNFVISYVRFYREVQNTLKLKNSNYSDLDARLNAAKKSMEKESAQNSEKAELVKEFEGSKKTDLEMENSTLEESDHHIKKDISQLEFEVRELVDDVKGVKVNNENFDLELEMLQNSIDSKNMKIVQSPAKLKHRFDSIKDEDLELSENLQMVRKENSELQQELLVKEQVLPILSPVPSAYKQKLELVKGIEEAELIYESNRENNSKVSKRNESYSRQVSDWRQNTQKNDLEILGLKERIKRLEEDIGRRKQDNGVHAHRKKLVLSKCEADFESAEDKRKHSLQRVNEEVEQIEQLKENLKVAKIMLQRIMDAYVKAKAPQVTT